MSLNDQHKAVLTHLDDHRPTCTCALWEQQWLPASPERCQRCGGMFPPHTVPARHPREGDEC